MYTLLQLHGPQTKRKKHHTMYC